MNKSEMVNYLTSVTNLYRRGEFNLKALLFCLEYVLDTHSELENIDLDMTVKEFVMKMHIWEINKKAKELENEE